LLEDFSLVSDSGDIVTLSSLGGSPVLLYFYPKDDTPGCTTQACGVRDAWDDFEAAGATVLGVSPDSEASVMRKVKPETHAADVLEALGS